jgi:predicted nucleotidyltransferase/DNA-binding XRE family transcriptional regulator
MAEVEAAALLRTARQRARMSQTDVARGAGVAQSVISAYESGQREPAIATLAKLVAATGHELVIDVKPVTGRHLGLPDTPLGRRLRRHRQAVLDTAARCGASNVRVFGSVARGEDGPDSDIDLLVELRRNVGLVGLGGLQRELSELLKVPVDVVPADSVKARVRINVEAEAIPL